MRTMVKIGKINIDTNVFLAPMSGCTDLPFRLIAREHGAKFCFFEMIDSNSVVYGNHRTFRMLKTTGEDSPIAGQILGSEPQAMLSAAEAVIERARISFIDINCACPVKKVVRKKAGAYLLKDHARLYAIIKKLLSSVRIPVTMKIRTGFDSKDIRRLTDMVKRCEELGVSAVFVHGRLAAQGYSGDVDYEAIGKVKEAVKIPVFGSGNIFSPPDAGKMLDDTGCDGILVARGALGNPWIFDNIHSYLKGKGLCANPPAEEKKKVLLRHLGYVDSLREMSPSGKVGFMKKVAIWYLKKTPNAARVRGKITSAKSREELLDAVK